jgi:hypothetical protein
MKATVALVLLLACWVADVALGSIVVSYPSVSSLDPLNRSVAPDAVHAAVAADNLVAGPGLIPYDPQVLANNIWFWTGWYSPSLTPSGGDSYALALAGGHTWTWGFEVTAPSTSIDLSSLSFSAGTHNNAMDFDLQFQVNGGPAIFLVQGETMDGGNHLIYALNSVSTLTTGDTILVTLIGYGASNDRLGLFAGTGDVGPGPGALLMEGDVTSSGVVPEAMSLMIWCCLISATVIGSGRRARS